jgi:hypothetical protein
MTDKSTFDLCASFQTAAFTHVEDRIKTALNYLDNNGVNVTALVVVGGVAANKELRRYSYISLYTCFILVMYIRIHIHFKMYLYMYVYVLHTLTRVYNFMRIYICIYAYICLLTCMHSTRQAAFEFDR